MHFCKKVEEVYWRVKHDNHFRSRLILVMPDETGFEWALVPELSQSISYWATVILRNAIASGYRSYIIQGLLP